MSRLPRARGARLAARVVSPRPMPTGIEQAAAELARLTTERGQLSRELTMLAAKTASAEHRLSLVEERMRGLLQHLHATVASDDAAG